MINPLCFCPCEKVARIDVGETHRAQLPLETFPISSGIIGGIAGGIAMVFQPRYTESFVFTASGTL